MSYAEHGPRIFLTGGPSSDVPLTYGDYVLPKKRSEGRLKLYDSCTDIRAWSPNVLENTRYFRELNEHGKSTPEKLTPFSVVMENMITLTAQAQRDLHVTRRELLRYRSLNLTPEQRDHLENFDRTTVETDKVEEMKIGSITRPLSQERCRLFNANNIVSSQHFDAYMWIYFRPDRFRYSRDDQPQLAHTCILKNYLNVKPLLENNAYLVSRVTSCNILPGEKATRDYNKQETFCIECVDASIQVERDICEMGVQTEECRDNDIYDKQSNVDSPSSQYYETGESTSTFESEFGINLDPESCERNHTEVIIQKDSEIIALKNELDMREDDLKDLQDLNRHLQTLLKEKDEDSNILKHNVNTLQEKLKVAKTSQDNKIADLNAKLSSVEYLMDQMKMELIRERQVCYSQSKEIRELKIKVEAAELHSMENQSLMRKVREMDRLSREAESCGDALKQMKNVCLERDMLQKQNYEQSCTLAERENEIKQLLTLIKQTSDKADTRESSSTNTFHDQVEMSGVVADLRNEIQAKNDKISQCEMQLVCMEREVGNLSDMLKSSLNNFDEAKIAFEGVCDYTKCEHDACLDVQSAVSALKAFVTELEECKLERRSRLQRIDNLKAYMACYSQETVGEITDTDFDTGRGSIQLAAGVSTHTSSNGDCRSSKELVNVQIQSDDVNTVITCSENLNELKLNEIISYKDIDRALATHMKRSIDKIHEISAVLQGAGDYHVNIVNELTRQQQELRKRDLEVQEHLRKRMLEKEQMLETVINERDTKIERLRENLVALETNVSSYRVECDQLKVERADLVDARNLLLKENEEQDEELRARGNQIRKLARQIDDLKQTVDDLRGEANDIKNMKEKLASLLLLLFLLFRDL
ncbi:hypothetical protein PUN28_001542 [Cardiocondyla obscurior]|uniref:Uncharacterized protein n=1 Tax=Cardiocondyla obscurior TaxID=286306 RepID=A0AAW2H5T1_9HYME